MKAVLSTRKEACKICIADFVYILFVNNQLSDDGFKISPIETYRAA